MLPALSLSRFVPARIITLATLREEPNLKGHIPALDAIRGLAILLVTSYRFWERPVGETVPSDALSHFFSLGFRGVDLFFILSGFLITGILFDAKQKPHYFRNFYMRRTLRIFPLYYAVLAVTLLILPLAGWSTARLFPEAHQDQAWLWLYGANVLQSLRGEWCLGSFNHFWSLAVEEHFYLFWPLVIYVCSRRTAMIACGSVVGIAAVVRTLWLLGGGNDVAAETFTLLRMDALAMGGLLALAIRGPGGVKALYPWAFGAVIFLAALLLPISLLHKRLLAIPELLFAAFFAGVILLALAASKEGLWGKLWNSRLLRFFGKYSYGMYVFQNLLIPVVASWLSVEILQEQLGNQILARLAYLTLMTALTIAAAMLSWHLFEKHVLKLKSWFE
ncbi:MAG: acyltransferase family protein [Pirellulaceae bacterium]